MKGPATPSDEALFAAAILIVEDSTLERELLGQYLAVEGFWNLEFAGDGTEGLAKIASFNPELVVLDILLPHIGGLELCRRLRGDPRTEDLPILVVTTIDATRSWRKLFAAGASDVVTKPITRTELVVRIRQQLERRNLLRSLRERTDRLHAELRAAGGMQTALLPTPAMQRDLSLSAGLDIGSLVAPSTEMGGDLWGLCDIGDGQIGVYVVDFSGHGVTAAINAFRLHAVLNELRPLWGMPVELTVALNVRLGVLLPRGQFATLLYGIIDTTTDEFRYCNAASPFPILRANAAAPLTPLAGSGLPLGIDPGAEYALQTVSLEPGGFVFLRSDGLDDALDSAGRRIGADAVFASVAASADAGSAQAMVDRICDEVLRDCREHLPDDVTAVCLMRGR